VDNTLVTKEFRADIRVHRKGNGKAVRNTAKLLDIVAQHQNSAEHEVTCDFYGQPERMSVHITHKGAAL
jgi:hypothetical protein